MNAAPFLSAAFTGKVGRFGLDVEFETPASGVTALVGPSGCGKSTVLRCIAGLTRLPGRLIVEGEIWQDRTRFLPAHDRSVGLVFQDSSLLPFLNVRGNLDYGWRRTSARRAIGFDETVAMLGLEALLERAPNNLSGGERQRVALGRALLSQPRILLLDEPLSNLHAEGRAEIEPYLERLHRELKMPILYVSHDAEEVRRIADHLLVMRDGHIVEKVIDLEARGDLRGRRSLDDARLVLATMSEAEVRALALTAIQARLKPRP